MVHSVYIYDFLVMFIASFAISDSWSSYITRSELEHETMEVSTDLDDFETFEDGIYFVIYDQNKKLEKGTLPRDFDVNAPLESGRLSKYNSFGHKSYYFDV